MNHPFEISFKINQGKTNRKIIKMRKIKIGLSQTRPSISDGEETEIEMQLEGHDEIRSFILNDNGSKELKFRYKQKKKTKGKDNGPFSFFLVHHQRSFCTCSIIHCLKNEELKISSGQ